MKEMGCKSQMIRFGESWIKIKLDYRSTKNFSILKWLFCKMTITLDTAKQDNHLCSGLECQNSLCVGIFLLTSLLILTAILDFKLNSVILLPKIFNFKNRWSSLTECICTSVSPTPCKSSTHLQLTWVYQSNAWLLVVCWYPASHNFNQTTI